MQVIRDIKNFPKLENVVVTNGTFDGCHVGHDAILNQLISKAKSINGKSVVLTYWPHPRIVLGKSSDNFKLLYTIEERIDLLSKYDIDYIVVLEFTKDFSQLTSEEFINYILINHLNTSELIIGYNHHFGKNREGGYQYLMNNKYKYPFEISEIPKQIIDDEGISSTKIRNYLKDGDLLNAKNYLNKNFQIEGVVVEGEKIGRTIGFPTANIEIDNKYKLIPGDGVYAVRINYNNLSYNGVMNIGVKPSLSSGKRTLEVHILNFDKNIYSEKLQIEFIERIRGEIKFSKINDLKERIEKDVELAYQILN